MVLRKLGMKEPCQGDILVSSNELGERRRFAPTSIVNTQHCYQTENTSFTKNRLQLGNTDKRNYRPRFSKLNIPPQNCYSIGTEYHLINRVYIYNAYP